MNKLVKVVMIAIGVLVLVIGIAFYVVLTNLDRIIMNAVESVGPEATGTEVTLDGVHVSMWTGEGSMRGFTIGNPAGFDSDYAFQLDRIDIGLDLQSVTSEVLVLERIVVDGARLVAEQKGTSRNNLQEILKNVEAYSGPSGESQDSETKLIIREFRFANSELTLRSDLLDVDKTVEIPEIVLHGIGERSQGATISEAARQLMKPVLAEAIRLAQKEALGVSTEDIKEEAEKKVRDKLKDLIGGG